MSQVEEKVFNHRKRMLHIVLVISMIWLGMGCFSYLLWGVMLPVLQKIYDSGTMPIPSELTVMIEQMLAMPRAYYLSLSLLYAMSFVGALRMWKLSRVGFHLYSLGKLLVLLVTVLFLGREMLQLGDVMMALLFIAMYYAMLRSLGAFAEKPTDETNSPDQEKNISDSSN